MSLLGADKVYDLDLLPMALKHKNLQILQGDITRTPFRDRTFDASIAVSTLEHVGLGYYGDPIQRDGDVRAIKEIARINRKKGLFYFSPPMESYWYCYLATDLRRGYVKNALTVRIKEYFIIGEQKKWKRVPLQKDIRLNKRGIVCMCVYNGYYH